MSMPVPHIKCTRIYIGPPQYDLNADYAPLSAIVCESPVSGVTLPLVVSLQSQETSTTVHAMAQAAQRAIPCSLGCDHGWAHEVRTDGTFVLFRQCWAESQHDASRQWRPTVGIGAHATRL